MDEYYDRYMDEICREERQDEAIHVELALRKRDAMKKVIDGDVLDEKDIKALLGNKEGILEDLLDAQEMEEYERNYLFV